MRRITYKTNRDLNIKSAFEVYEKDYFFNKSVTKEFQFLNSFSYLFYKRFFFRINGLSKFRIRCLFTGRYRGTQSFFMMSRMYFKKLALNGFLSGVKKAS
jgi:ribosomal protein S14